LGGDCNFHLLGDEKATPAEPSFLGNQDKDYTAEAVLFRRRQETIVSDVPIEEGGPPLRERFSQQLPSFTSA
jgi:hypothetical protein